MIIVTGAATMSKRVSILACGLVAGLLPFNAQAVPSSLDSKLSASAVIAVRDFCGLGFHRNPWGACVANGTPYGYVAPVVVAPAVVAPTVIVPPRAVVCPYGYYF